MGDFNWQMVETIIDEVLDLPRDERQAFIEKKCSHNKALKGEVTRLLDSIFDSEGWLEDPNNYKEDLYQEISKDIESLSSGHSLIGQQVGSYIIKEQIGEGGMGSVYIAERTDGTFEHQVAIKIIKRGRNTHKNILRFHREQQILAGLNHPGIGRLYDGGVTEDGFPYIIMEYVDGLPIDEYCSKHNCSVDEKIALFKQVLEAVRYAHENLVIHRDLKPGNILVDNSGVVKILDFGISKLLENDEELSLTQTGARLLTPRYAAPEQIRQEKITTSCDLYALGIVFYKLLTESFPFNFDGKSRYEMEQTILNVAPLRPSAIADMAETGKQLKGDLDAIMLKAIRKDPEERYRGITEFLDDLVNYQHDLPINAQRGKTSYRISKFFKRHKKGAAIAASVLLLLIGLTAFYAWRITQERNQAQQQAERAEEITDFLVTILRMNNPSENSGEDITVSDALIRGVDYLDEQQMSSLNRATILGTIGSIQINTGDLDQAGAALEKAMSLVTDSLTEQSERTLSIGTEYAEWQTTVGNYKEAEQTFRLTDSLFQAKKLTKSNHYFELLLNYSDFLMETGKFEKALEELSKSEQYFKSSGNKDRHTLDLQADLYNNRGRAYKNMGQNEKALADLNKALAIKEEIYDDDNPKIGRLYNNIGVVYATTGNFEQAKQMAERAYEIRSRTLGPEHHLVGSTLNLLGTIALQLGNYEQALNYNKESIRISKQEYGPNHFRYALAIRQYARTLIATGRTEEAIQQLDQATSIIVGNYGESHPYYGYMTQTYTAAYGKAEDYELAMKYGKETITNFEKSLGPNHPDFGKMLFSQGKYAVKRDKFQQADTLLTAALQVLESHFNSDDPLLTEADSLLKLSKSNL